MSGQCAAHPDTPAAFTCERCGDYACDACRAPGALERCARCQRQAGDEVSHVAIAAAVFGFFGVGCAPVGCVGILLGAFELWRLVRDERTGGRVLAGIGLGGGLLGTTVWTVAVVYAALNLPPGG